MVCDNLSGTIGNTPLVRLNKITSGLTGKYVGASGKCTYENKSQVMNGVVYGINPVKCNVTK